MAANTPKLQDGCASFTKVDTRTPSHELPAGVAAGAINKRFEDGRAVPRFGVVQQPWGRLPDVSIPGVWPTAPSSHINQATVTGFVVGLRYKVVLGNALELSESSQVVNMVARPAGAEYVGTAEFVATRTTYTLWAMFHDGQPITTYIGLVRTPLAFARFNDPKGRDTLVLVVDEWRNRTDEDLGRGRAYRIRSGQGPVEISLNGHDVWGEARLVPCFNGLVLLRQGAERHYFDGSKVAESQIELNCAPNWKDGDEVLLSAVDPDAIMVGDTPPMRETRYWVKAVAGGNKVELYSGDTLGTRLEMTGATGRWFLERRASKPGYQGNGAPPLLAQAETEDKTLWDVGFKALQTQTEASAFAANTLSVPNHRLIAGDKLTYVHATATPVSTETFYACPVDDNSITLHATLDEALAGTSPKTPAPVFAAHDYVKREGASGMAMPPGREGTYLGINRLVVVNGQNNLAISDPLDPLHYTAYAATVSANLGESDPVNSIIPLGKDTVIVGKQNSLLALSGLSGTAGNWSLTEVTREYGFGAPLATVLVGRDVWGFSRKGVVSLNLTEQGQLQGVAIPVSYPMQKYLDLVDWQHYSQAAAATWNNRYFLAVPLKGQSGVIKNNGVLVYNFLTGGWEGLWQGDQLEVYAFARCSVYGEERLCFANYSGAVCWLGDGFDDMGTPIQDKLLTRTYTAGTPENKLWLEADVVWDTFNPALTVTAITPGYNERQSLLAKTYDPQGYRTYGAHTNPLWGDAHREDYSPTADELFEAEVDTHQNTPEPLRMRLNDWGVQLEIINSTGSARLVAVMVRGVPTGRIKTV